MSELAQKAFELLRQAQNTKEEAEAVEVLYYYVSRLIAREQIAEEKLEKLRSILCEPE
jgi:hypothetical protein